MTTAQELIEQECASEPQMKAHSHEYAIQRLDAAERIIERLQQRVTELEREQCPHDYGLAKAALLREPEYVRRIDELERGGGWDDKREAYRARLDAMVGALVPLAVRCKNWEATQVKYATTILAAIDAFVAKREQP